MADQLSSEDAKLEHSIRTLGDHLNTAHNNVIDAYAELAGCQSDPFCRFLFKHSYETQVKMALFTYHHRRKLLNDVLRTHDVGIHVSETKK